MMKHYLKIAVSQNTTCSGMMTADLEVRSEWIRKTHVARECREYEIPHLDTVRRNHITEREVIVTQELREIM